MLGIYDFILSPLITEKNTYNERFNKYTYRVLSKCNKKRLKEAVEMIYNVDVLSINILNVKKKLKVYRGVSGARVGFKKAVVTTCKRIDIFKVEV